MESDGKDPRGGALFALLFLVLALILLTRIGTEVKFSPKGALFAQPGFWPAVGLCGMAVFGAIHCAGALRRVFGREGMIAGELAAGAGWLRALEYFLWFMAYVFAAPVAGYLATTVAFMALLVLRAGYRGGRPVAAAAAVGLAIVLIFKTALGVKIPGGAVYEHLPDALSSFMLVNF